MALFLHIRGATMQVEKKNWHFLLFAGFGPIFFANFATVKKLFPKI